jgi:glyoxylase-like metal-dependent hydrolase (beta-lactamase superfamily II)
LTQNLAGAGIKPEDIDTVVYTHAHPDHHGGTVDQDGRLNFLKAIQVMTRKEWECLSAPGEGPGFRMFAFARRVLLPLRERFTLVEDNYEVVPGVKLLPSRGHTLGGVLIEVTSGKDSMVCIGDLIHSRREFVEPGFYSFLDSAPDEALKLRTDGMVRMAESRALVFASHMAFPGLGRFVKKDGGLDWEPALDSV